ncbi:hypothetical protein [Nocardia sp. NPDC051833]|uniref:hypothetical protein n=1 Tax=Nocardia sp. NPDC051833 TaxID=3155674 RepID=UPI00342CF64C
MNISTLESLAAWATTPGQTAAEITGGLADQFRVQMSAPPASTVNASLSYDISKLAMVLSIELRHAHQLHNYLAVQIGQAPYDRDRDRAALIEDLRDYLTQENAA